MKALWLAAGNSSPCWQLFWEYFLSLVVLVSLIQSYRGFIRFSLNNSPAINFSVKYHSCYLWITVMPFKTIRRPITIRPEGKVYDWGMKARIHLGIVLVLSLLASYPVSVYNERQEEIAQVTATAKAMQTFYMAMTQTAIPTFTPIPPTLPPPTHTNTPKPTPTQTSTPLPTKCSTISDIRVRDKLDGDYLDVNCSNDFQFVLGPIAKGAYAIGPNGKFLVYCTNYGYVYTSRAEEGTLEFFKNIRPKIPIIRIIDDPILEIEFFTSENQYWAKIREKRSGQNTDLPIPLRISN